LGQAAAVGFASTLHAIKEVARLIGYRVRFLAYTGRSQARQAKRLVGPNLTHLRSHLCIAETESGGEELWISARTPDCDCGPRS
jgi:hypothetical protein